MAVLVHHFLYLKIDPPTFVGFCTGVVLGIIFIAISQSKSLVRAISLTVINIIFLTLFLIEDIERALERRQPHHDTAEPQIYKLSADEREDDQKPPAVPSSLGAAIDTRTIGLPDEQMRGLDAEIARLHELNKLFEECVTHLQSRCGSAGTSNGLEKPQRGGAGNTATKVMPFNTQRPLPFRSKPESASENIHQSNDIANEKFIVCFDAPEPSPSVQIAQPSSHTDGHSPIFDASASKRTFLTEFLRQDYHTKKRSQHRRAQAGISRGSRRTPVQKPSPLTKHCINIDDIGNEEESAPMKPVKPCLRRWNDFDSDVDEDDKDEDDEEHDHIDICKQS